MIKSQSLITGLYLDHFGSLSWTHLAAREIPRPKRILYACPDFLIIRPIFCRSLVYHWPQYQWYLDDKHHLEYYKFCLACLVLEHLGFQFHVFVCFIILHTYVVMEHSVKWKLRLQDELSSQGWHPSLEGLSSCLILSCMIKMTNFL